MIRKTPLKKKPYRIKPVSDKLKAEREIYKTLKKDYLKDVPNCELYPAIEKYKFDGGNARWWPVCSTKSVDIHHAKGRIGKNLTDVENFRATCDSKKPLCCHRWVEEHPEAAKLLNLSVSRLGPVRKPDWFPSKND